MERAQELAGFVAVSQRIKIRKKKDRTEKKERERKKKRRWGKTIDPLVNEAR